ncbi:MAG: endonuclease/exonuclease/phosphatase family protein [Termitinemataceae bacterium]
MICAVVLSLYLACTGCEQPLRSAPQTSLLQVATWNLQALFDDKDDGTEYEDYRSNSGWTVDKYRTRLQRFGEALAHWPSIQNVKGPAGPDILALIEVENTQVIQDLLAGPLNACAYTSASFASQQGSPLGLAILSRYPILNSTTHIIQAGTALLPRPVLEVQIRLPGKQGCDCLITVFVCHWKSKLGNVEESALLRRAGAQVVNRRITDLCNSENQSQPFIMILGDLNESYDEFYREGQQRITAVIPWNQNALISDSGNFSTGNRNSMITDSDLLEDLLSTDPYQEHLPFPDIPSFILTAASPLDSSYLKQGQLLFYSPWYHADTFKGSYAYQRQWETIDHILLSPAFFQPSQWKYRSFSVLDLPPFTNSAQFPNSYNPRTGTGLSDHLPIMVHLELTP